MERTLARSRSIRIVLLSIAVAVAASGRASAGLLASDSYTTGTDPLSGQYTAGTALSGQSATLANNGFETGGYTHGAGTSNFVSSSQGLVSATDGSTTSSGSVAWIGAPLDSTYRSVARNLSTFNEGNNNNTYWMSFLVSSSGNQTTTSGYALAGFGGTVAPTLGTTTGFLQGVYVGFANENGGAGEADLVLRYRDTTGMTSADKVLVNGAGNATANQTYLVVMEVTVNANGGSVDPVNYWVNPPDLNSINDLNQTTLQGSVNTYSFQGATSGNGDFTRLNYASTNWNGDAFFDEARLGTSLASISPIPEPTSLVLSALGGGIVILGSLRRRRLAGR